MNGLNGRDLDIAEAAIVARLAAPALFLGHTTRDIRAARVRAELLNRGMADVAEWRETFERTYGEPLGSPL